MRPVLVALAIVVAFVAAPSTATAGGKACGDLTVTGLTMKKTRAYAIPCSLSDAALTRWVLRGERDFDSKIRFRWRGLKADFYCYWLNDGAGGKCKGGVRKNGRTPYYGTGAFLKSSPVLDPVSIKKECDTISIYDVPTTIAVIRGVSCTKAVKIAQRWAAGSSIDPWQCFVAREGEDHKLACGAEGAGNVQWWRRAFLGL